MNINKELEIFFAKRNHLIDLLDEGKIDKEIFIDNNYRLIDELSMKPFPQVKSYEEGMYNYQYYNTLAKYFNTRANEVKFDKNKQRQYKDSINKCNNYYYEKDRTLKQMLYIKEFKNMTAYFVTLFSERLQTKLYEIVFIDEEKAVFHSMNPTILKELKSYGVFEEGERPSVIDGYINEKY